MIHYNKKSGATRKPLNDTYFTNPETVDLCLKALDGLVKFSHRKEISILDPGCGKGAWGTAARRVLNAGPYAGPYAGHTLQHHITGVDINPVGDLAGYDRVVQHDYLTWDPDTQEQQHAPGGYDLVIGNPPYGRRVLSPFIEKSFALCRDLGYVAFLLRMEFLEGQHRGRYFWRSACPVKVWVLSDRACFNGEKTPYPGFFGLFLWQKGPRMRLGTYPTSVDLGEAPTFNTSWLHKDLPCFLEEDR